MPMTWVAVGDSVGVGAAGCDPGRPSLRTGLAGFPHPALRSMVHPLGECMTGAGTLTSEKSPSFAKKAFGQR